MVTGTCWVGTANTVLTYAVRELADKFGAVNGVAGSVLTGRVVEDRRGRQYMAYLVYDGG